MNTRDLAAVALNTIDRWIAPVCLAAGTERPGLITFLIHGLFLDEAEIALESVDPQQRTTVADFERLVEYFTARGYRFVGPDDVLAGTLDPRARHAMLTFDDGYFNNMRALPVLRRFNVPATFFISTDHVRHNKCFWWDVLYRESRRAGVAMAAIRRDGGRLKSMTTEGIEAELTGRYGARAFAPVGDSDRPFSPTELRDFARDPLVRLGNHTASHAILTNYPPADARAQIERAQAALEEMTGTRPIFIAYPNGDCDDAVVAQCRALGIGLGIGVEPGRNPLPFRPGTDRRMRLKRFTPPGGAGAAVFRTYRSGVSSYELMHRLAKRPAARETDHPAPSRRFVSSPGNPREAKGVM